MPDTGAPWNIPYVASSDLVKDWPTDNQTMAEAIADALDVASVVRQISQIEVTDTLSATVASLSLTEISDFNLTITPASATSKILLQLDLNGRSTPEGFGIVIERDGTAISVGASAGSRTAITGWGLQVQSATLTIGDTHLTVLDAPATTSAVTYTVNLFNVRANTNTYYINRTVADVNDASYTRAASRFIATELVP